MMDYENYDEGAYCENCDQSFYGDPLVDQIDEWRERYGCPNCGHFDPETLPTDYFLEVAGYFLSVADDEIEAMLARFPLYLW